QRSLFWILFALGVGGSSPEVIKTWARFTRVSTSPRAGRGSWAFCLYVRPVRGEVTPFAPTSTGSTASTDHRYGRTKTAVIAATGPSAWTITTRGSTTIGLTVSPSSAPAN